MENRGEFPDQQAYFEDEAHISSAKPSDKVSYFDVFFDLCALRSGELFLKERGLFYGPQEFIDILSGIERWLAKDIKQDGGM